MDLLLVFALVLLAGVLISGVAHRTVLSTAVLFLTAGFLLGDGVTGVLHLKPGQPIVNTLAELALFSVLFTDGQHLGARDLRSAWKLPGRALLLGMPLTFGISALFGVLLAGLTWPESLLVAAVLAPTDPVFAAAIVGRDEVPARLRHILNVESGLNDGLALPVVLLLISLVGGQGVDLLTLAGELGLGIVIGIAIPLAAWLLLKSRFFTTTPMYEALTPVAIGLIVLAVADLTGANLFLAAFAAGITVATVAPELRESFQQFGELVTELLKLLAILVFGALISPSFLSDVSLGGWVFAVLLLTVARPAAILAALAGSGVTRAEKLTAGWFGPKGFASVLYGLLVLGAGSENSDKMFHLIVVAIVLSIVAHSSTDVPIARYFSRLPDASAEPGSADRAK